MGRFSQKVMDALKKAKGVTIDWGPELYEGGHLNIHTGDEGGYIISALVPDDFIVEVIKICPE